MMKFTHILILMLTAGLLWSCGTTSRTVQSSSPTAESGGESSVTPATISVSKYKEMQVSLEQAHRDWKGTPYRWGGTSSRGIDCSAFMQVIFDDYFGVDLPRNTKRQLYSGANIRRKALTTGDLVFFKTGRKTLHVGVIVEGNEFLHASTSEGVTTSSMDDHYWKSRYLAGRRIVELRL